MADLSGEARIDALCETLVTSHGMVIPLNVYDPAASSGSEKYGVSDWTSASGEGLDYPDATDNYHSGTEETPKD